VFILLMIVMGEAQHPDSPHRMRQMTRMLDLTEEQQSQILDMKLKLKKEVVPLQSDIERLRSELKLEMTADKFNEGKVKKLVQDISIKQQELKLSRIGHHRAVRDILTPDQQKKFDMRILSERGSGKGRGHGRDMRSKHYRQSDGRGPRIQ
jgi:Spy/CpxP family protein refolding chaperone